MNIRLHTITKAVDEDLTLMEIVAQAARVSNPSNSFNHETAEKLVRFLIKNQHWSPLEMADVGLHITTTRDISHQMIRHRSFFVQEFSQRYSEIPSNMVHSEARLQDDRNRQNSIIIEDEVLQKEWEETCQKIFGDSIFHYQMFRNRGVAKEVTRKILPEGLTETQLYMKGSLRSWLHYCSVRCHKSTQKEHRDVALECSKVINTVFPMFNETVNHMLKISDIIKEYWENV